MDWQSTYGFQEYVNYTYTVILANEKKHSCSIKVTLIL